LQHPDQRKLDAELQRLVTPTNIN